MSDHSIEYYGHGYSQQFIGELYGYLRMESSPLHDMDRQKTLSGGDVIPVLKIFKAKLWLKEKISKDKRLLYYADTLFDYVDQAFNVRR